MCRHATFAVPPEPGAVPAARQFCRDTLTRWQLEPLLDDAQVVLSELVTNGVLHGGTPLAVSVSSETGNLELAVSDGNPTPPVLRPAREDLAGDLDTLLASSPGHTVADDRDPRLDVGASGSVVGGRGLQLVGSLCQDWGVASTSTGKSVWARLRVPAGWPHAVGCGCAAGEVRLSSGRTVAPR